MPDQYPGDPSSDPAAAAYKEELYYAGRANQAINSSPPQTQYAAVQWRIAAKYARQLVGTYLDWPQGQSMGASDRAKLYDYYAQKYDPQPHPNASRGRLTAYRRGGRTYYAVGQNGFAPGEPTPGQPYPGPEPMPPPEDSAAPLVGAMAAISAVIGLAVGFYIGRA